MGGKNKQSQRTKNNVRPSNSGRSAEILSNAAKLDGSLLSGGKVLPALFPTMAASLDQGLTTELALCFKKLNKKDPITRTKALQELTELVNNSSVDDVVVALPSWALAYRSLVMDTDKKVRENAQVCHAAIVSLCGRRLCGSLKALAPPWLCAQHDDHAPARTLAQHSLNSTFPKEKLPDLVTFCKEEVMSHLIDNLTGVTEAIINKKLDSPSEKELQVRRVRRAGLQGLQHFALHLPRQHDDWFRERLEALSQAYWKLPHTDAMVRAAWCGATGRLLERFGASLGALFIQKALRVVLASAAGEQWDCLLNIMHHVTDWHTMLDKKELLIKRILDTLESGGWGDARHLCNILLPLLAHLPEDILTKEFYQSFFNAAFAGLEKKTIIASKSERQWWITSIAECLRYVSIQDADYSIEVATSAHRTWLEHSLNISRDGAIKDNLIKCTAQNMTDLFKYLLKQNTEKYQQLIRNFWQNIGSTMSNQIDKVSIDNDEVIKLIDGHILFLLNLKSMFLQEAKKQQSISFDGDVQKVENDKVVIEKCDKSTIDRYKHNLNELVNKICAKYFEFAASKQLPIVLTPLITLLKEFDSKELYLCIGSGFKCDCVYSLYDVVLCKWLSGDTMRGRAVVDIVFMMMKYMSEEEQRCMFKTFQQFPPPVIEWCISLSLSHPYSSLQSVREWLRSSTVEHSVVSLSRRLLNDGSGDSILFMCLSHNDGDILITDSTLSTIKRMFASSLADTSAPLLERRARVCTALCGSGGSDVTLVDAMFRLTADLQRGNDKLSTETWNEVLTTWKEAALSLPGEQREAFLKQARDILHDRLYTSDLDLKAIEHATSLVPELLSCDESSPDVTEILKLTQFIFTLQPSPSSIETAALRCDCIKSKLNCPFDDDNELIKKIIHDSNLIDIQEITKEEVLKYANNLLFRAICLRRLFLHRNCEEEMEIEEEGKWGDVLLKEEYFQKEFCAVLYEYCVINTLYENYAFWPHYEIIQQTKTKMDSVLEAIVKETPTEITQTISSMLSEKAASIGYYWAYSRTFFEKITKGKVEDKEDAVDFEKLDDVVTGNGFFHSLQATTTVAPSSSLRNKYLVMLRSIHAAFSADKAVIDETFVRELLACEKQCDLDVIVNLYYRHNDVMLYERELTSAPWSQIVSNAAILEFLCELISQRGWDLPAQSWDFITIALCSLLYSVERSKASWGCTKLSLISESALRLLAAVARFCGGVPGRCRARAPPAHVLHLATEWKDIFAPDLMTNLFSLLMFVLESPLPTLTSPQASTLSLLISSCPFLEWDRIPGGGAGGGGAKGGGAPSLSALQNVCVCVQKARAHYHFKILADEVMGAIMKPLVLDDAEKLAIWSTHLDSLAEDEEVKDIELTIAQYQGALKELYAIVDTALSHVRICSGSCSLVPHSDCYALCLGYLLLHARLARAVRAARSALRHHYLQAYTANNYIAELLSVCLRLLPETVVSHMCSEDETPAKCSYFTEDAVFVASEPSTSTHISALACRCTLLAFSTDGHTARNFVTQHCTGRMAVAVRALVQGYIAPPLVKEQLNIVKARAGELEDTEIQIHWQSQEVICLLTVETRRLELTIRLDPAHPLQPPRVVPGGAGGAAGSVGGKYDPAPAVHWLAVYLSAQNGTILNALKMWINAVSSRVSSAPQCYICYCRLQPASGRLPATQCHQCRNRFHTQCLRKWFKSSSKSSCPLCRTNF